MVEVRRKHVFVRKYNKLFVALAFKRIAKRRVRAKGRVTYGKVSYGSMRFHILMHAGLPGKAQDLFYKLHKW